MRFRHGSIISRASPNEVIIIDAETVIGGSYRHTVSADLHNAENMLIVHNPALAKLNEQDFENRLAVRERFSP